MGVVGNLEIGIEPCFLWLVFLHDLFFYINIFPYLVVLSGYLSQYVTVINDNHLLHFL